MTFTIALGWWLAPATVSVICLVTYLRVADFSPFSGYGGMADVVLNLVKALVFGMISSLAWLTYSILT